ncbi:hypothetical protein C8Q76DRAFT_765852 [Earliella scabrosa]|nr:hypothetical protein C8Q76DRAFT_765852 [Earliella scabrosa]
MAGLMTVVSAHFELQFPPPRGETNTDNQVTFCDGYANSAANRTVFPTSGGFVSIIAKHPDWTLGGIISTAENANSFDTFRDDDDEFQQFLPFFKTSDVGDFCVNVNLTASGVEGIRDGANVTIQLVFDGGDGQLYQCADLTLSDNATIPESVSCRNSTANVVVTPVATDVAPTATGDGHDHGDDGHDHDDHDHDHDHDDENSALRNAAIGASGIATLVGAIFALL